MSLSWFERLFIYIVSQGEMPRHVAFIMDGNRRFARKEHIEIQKGHEQGFDKLNQVVEVCMRLGVRYVTVFAFALANFYRSNSEVEMLIKLIEDKLQDSHWINDFIEKHEIQIRIAGEMQFIRPSLRKSIKNIVDRTKHYNKMILNVCVAYGGRYEMVQGIKKIACEKKHMQKNKLSDLKKEKENTEKYVSTHHKACSGYNEDNLITNNNNNNFDCIKNNNIRSVEDTQNAEEKKEEINYEEEEKEDGIWTATGNVSAAMYWKSLYTSESPAPDLLIRTSGETRLSDFLIYQCSERTYLEFLPVYWPELTVTDLLRCFLHYQIFSPASRK